MFGLSDTENLILMQLIEQDIKDMKNKTSGKKELTNNIDLISLSKEKTLDNRFNKRITSDNKK
jgi:hypothetical protein